MKHFKEGNNPEPEYDKSLVVNTEGHDSMAEYEQHCACNYEPDPDDWYEGTHHFED